MPILSIMAFVAVMWGLWSSYKLANKPIWQRPLQIPIEKYSDRNQINPTLYLIVVFSRQGCISCLQQIQFLSQLDDNFVLIGAVPDKELNDIDFFKALGISIPLIGYSTLRGWTPPINPSIIGVNSEGAPLFTIPLLGRIDTVIELLMENYNMLWPFLVKGAN